MITIERAVLFIIGAAGTLMGATFMIFVGRVIDVTSRKNNRELKEKLKVAAAKEKEMLTKLYEYDSKDFKYTKSGFEAIERTLKHEIEVLKRRGVDGYPKEIVHPNWLRQGTSRTGNLGELRSYIDDQARFEEVLRRGRAQEEQINRVVDGITTSSGFSTPVTISVGASRQLRPDIESMERGQRILEAMSQSARMELAQNLAHGGIGIATPAQMQVSREHYNESAVEQYSTGFNVLTRGEEE